MNPAQHIVVIGGSAGGIEALRELLGALPANLDAAIVVVIHIPPHSPSQLARVLAGVTDMPVSTPGDKEKLYPAHVYVACADKHLMVENGIVRQTRGPKECRVRPAVDVLFRSAAVGYGPRAVGVLLSGMLDDGTAGLWAIKDKGGIALVQDPAQAMHSPMPESAIRHVKVDLVGSSRSLAQAIQDAVSRDIPPAAAAAPGRLEVETQIAGEGNGLQLGVMKMGKASQYTCPDCHGVLVQIEEGSITRFRCHTGHAFSLQTLLADVGESIDKGLWDTIRSIEERVMLLRQMAKLEAGHSAGDAKALEQLADDAEKKTRALKDLVMDSSLFGRQA